MQMLADEFFERLEEFREEYEWLEHDDGKSILKMIGDVIEHMTNAHKANIGMAALTEIIGHGDVIEWDWSRLAKVRVTPDWKAEIDDGDGYVIFSGPELFDRLHDLNAFAYFGILPAWSDVETRPDDQIDPRMLPLLNKRKAQQEIENWVQQTCEEIDDLEKLLPGTMLKNGLFGACITTRTAARARLKYDNGAPLAVSELAALSRVSLKRLQNAIYAKTDEAPLVSKSGQISAENARPWLEARDFKPSIWQAVQTLQPLKTGWGEDIPYAGAAPESQIADFVFVPIANDGTEFLPDICWRQGGGEVSGGYSVGPKGSEVKVPDYRAALDLLAKMETPRWRRPNPESGHWGIVTGQAWRRVSVNSLSSSSAQQGGARVEISSGEGAK